MRRRSGHLFKRGNVWHVQWRVGNRLYSRSTGQSSRREAERERSRILAPFQVEQEEDVLQHIQARIQGTQVDRPETPVTEMWDLFAKSKVRSKRAGERTLEGYASHWSEFLAWLAKTHREVAASEAISPDIAAEFMDHVEKTFAPTTYNRKLQTLTLVFKAATPHHQPFAEFKKNPEEQAEREPFTDDEMRQIRQRATGDMAKLIDLGILTGQRLEDLCLLKKNGFDTPSQFNGYHRGYLTLRQRKTRKWVNIPAAQIRPLWDLLTDLSLQSDSEFLLPELASRYQKDYRDSYVSKCFGRLLDECGIHRSEKRQNGKNAISRKSFHSLRHGFDTIARLCGIPDSVIQSITGHSSKMLEHYSHLTPVQVSAFLKAAGIDGAIKESVKALPPSTTFPPDMNRIRALAESLNSENWAEVKSNLLQLVGSAAVENGTAPAE